MEEMKKNLMGAIAVLALLFGGTALAQSPSGLPTGASLPAPAEFEDVHPDHWAADAITRLSALGVITGYPNGTFAGSRAATRYELAVVSARLLDLLSTSITDLISDRDFRRAIEDAASNHARLLRLEELVENAADSDYLWDLAERLAQVEEYLNMQAGEALFPGLAGLDDDGLRVAERDPLTDEELAAIMAQLEEQVAAQRAGAMPQRYFGVYAGYPVAGGLHIGMRDLLTAGLGARFGVGYALPGAFAMELAVLYEFEAIFGQAGTALYVGPGVLARFGSGVTALDLELIIGVEHSLPRGPVAVFGEFGPGFTMAPEAGNAGLIARVGLNYGF